MQKLFENWRKFRKNTLNEQMLPGPFSLEHKAVKHMLTALSNSKSIPLHLRAFARYLSGSGDLWTEDEFTEEQKKQLTDLVLYVQWQNMRFARAVQENPKKWKGKRWVYKGYWDDARIIAKQILDDEAKGRFAIGSYHVYPRHQGLATTGKREEEDVPNRNLQANLPLLGGNFAEQIERFLGRSTVQFERGKSLTIIDKYDFGQLSKDGQEHEIKDLGDAIVNFFDWYSLVPSQLYIKIRNTAPYIGKSFPVRIKLDI